jgi:hypothetical protein
LKELGRSLEGLTGLSATDRDVGGTGRIDASLRDTYTGETLVKMPPARKEAQEHHFFRANRNALRSWLGEGFDICFNHKLVSYHVNIQAGTITAEFENGKSAVGSLLVVAHDLHSAGS